MKIFREVSAYGSKKSSPFAELLKSSKHSSQRYIEDTIHVRDFNFVPFMNLYVYSKILNFQIPDAQVVTSLPTFTTGSPVYIVAGDNWASLEELAMQVLIFIFSQFVSMSIFIQITGKLTSYTGILTKADAVSERQVFLHNSLKLNQASFMVTII